MGLLLRGCLLSLSFLLFATAPAAAAPLTMEVVDADVSTLLASIARVAGINLILDDSVQGRISLSLKEVEPEEALDLIAKAKGLVMQHEGKVLLVRSAKEAAPFYRMYVLPVRYADLHTAFAAVKLSLGEAGIYTIDENKKNGIEDTTEQTLYRTGERLLIDRATNALLFYGTEEEKARAEAALSPIDVPTQQVSLEARVVALEKGAAKSLGVDWDWSPAPIDSHGEGKSGAKGSRRGIDGEVPGVIRFGRTPEGAPYEFYYRAKIAALVTDGKANVLARPNITTLQGREAVINIGGSVPVPETQTTNSTVTTSITYKPAGIILRYTPRIHENDEITATVHTEVSSPVYVDDLKAYKFQERSADTTVRLKDGETMVIGGLIGSEESRTFAKVPFLGDIPVLGAFFKSVRHTKTDSEIMIFLTAHILRDTSPLAEGRRIENGKERMFGNGNQDLDRR